MITKVPLANSAGTLSLQEYSMLFIQPVWAAPSHFRQISQNALEAQGPTVGPRT